MGALAEFWRSKWHPSEIQAMIDLKRGKKIAVAKRNKTPLRELAHLPARDFCYQALTKVSRSFAIVIQQLPEELRDPICVFYLVLRGLDTVEDDMELDIKTKAPLLVSFHEKIEQDGWCVAGIGPSNPDEEVMLEKFGKVIELYKTLKPEYRATIKDITRRMGAGMNDFATRKKVDSTADYDLYCHYVAGLVGIGLSRLFFDSGLEGEWFGKENNQERLSNSMGLFLQKTNITRDYLEDLEDGRIFWPKKIWSQHADQLEFFAQHPYHQDSLSALNHMILNSLSHLPDCLEYMSQIKDPQIFRFCAIPQVMAIATMAELYNNSEALRGVVKIRKGMSARILLEVNDNKAFRRFFRQFTLTLEQKVLANQARTSDQQALDIINRTLSVLQQAKAVTSDVELETLNESALRFSTVVAVMLLLASFGRMVNLFTHVTSLQHVAPDSVGYESRDYFWDLSAVLVFGAMVSYLLTMFGVHFRQARQVKLAAGQDVSQATTKKLQ